MGRIGSTPLEKEVVINKMSGDENNPEENIGEFEEAEIGVTRPVPSSYAPAKRELNVKVGRKWKGWILTHYIRIIKALLITAVLIPVVVGVEELWAMLANHHDNIISEWPTVSGTVISTKRGTMETVNDKYPTLTIRFEYMVRGVTYQDSQELLVDDHYGEEARYPLGSSIIVYYNPAKPGSALISPRASIPWWKPLGVFPLILAFIGCIYIGGWWVRGK